MSEDKYVSHKQMKTCNCIGKENCKDMDCPLVQKYREKYPWPFPAVEPPQDTSGYGPRVPGGL